MSKEKAIPSTVKFSPELQLKVDEAAKKTGLPKQEIIRLCTAIGIEDLRKVGWDLARLVSDAAIVFPKLEALPDADKQQGQNGTK
jgi:hypothetical protein